MMMVPWVMDNKGLDRGIEVFDVTCWNPVTCCDEEECRRYEGEIRRSTDVDMHRPGLVAWSMYLDLHKDIKDFSSGQQPYTPHAMHELCSY